MIFRTATDADIPSVVRIICLAVDRMLAEGRRQWDRNYPSEVHIRADIERGAGYVIESEGEVVAYGAVFTDGEPAYGNINGKWLTKGDNYVVVHRLAVLNADGRRGLGILFLKKTEELARDMGIMSFRVDTNIDNSVMLRILDKLEFTYCGEIEYQHGKRMAFEKLL